MKVSVFGTGYVGLVTGVCFAEMGNDVVCVDIDPDKIKMLEDGKSPIYEPGLTELLTRNIKDGRIRFTKEAKIAVEESEVVFIAVGTPPGEDGSADLKYVIQAAEDIATHINSYKVIVNKSTVPVGTFGKVKQAVAKILRNNNNKTEFDICSNPEFLREGCAIQDCLTPNRVVIGVENERVTRVMTRLYEPFLKNGHPILVMDPASSEMTKYAANAMLATKISLMNEFSRFCEKVGADIEAVRRGIGSDHRIGPHFIYAGLGYGGSCFPKDVQALIRSGDACGEDLKILKAVEDANYLQRLRFLNNVRKTLGENIKGKRVGVWGVAFKPGTDDVREAPSLFLIRELLAAGVQVCAYDPVAREAAEKALQSEMSEALLKNLFFVDDQYSVADAADALIIVTEWKSFKEPDFAKIKSKLKQANIFDGRNLYSPKDMVELGFNYVSVGRS